MNATTAKRLRREAERLTKKCMDRVYIRHPDPIALCRWVAEELLGWQPLKTYPGFWYVGTDQLFWQDVQRRLQSWHGIGLVIEAMSKRSEGEWTRFNNILKEVPPDDPHWWEYGEPWEIVYPAAQRAVEGE